MSSRYDRVKVKVNLDVEQYYILSRFLFSKMLMLCKVPTTDAVRISLALKKFFVDQEKLDISQQELECATFSVMSQYGYGEARKKLFPVMTRLYMERVPLIIFIAGAGCCGKTAIAHSLSLKLSTHVISTDVLMDILAVVHDTFPSSGSESGPETSSMWPCSDNRGLWMHEMSNEDEFVALWHSWVKAVQPLVESELDKALTEGKVILVEGSLLDLSLYRSYLRREHQQLHGAIVVAFHVTCDAASRQHTVERYLSAQRDKLPAAYMDDFHAAVAWMTQRLTVVEDEHLNAIARDSAVSLRSVRNEGMAVAPLLDVLESNDLLWESEGLPHSVPEPTALRWDDDESEELLPVYVVTCAVEEPTRPHEIMHEVVLERIMDALYKQDSTSDE